MVPLLASNRIGREQLPGGEPTTYFGGSFIAGPKGEIMAQVGVGVLVRRRSKLERGGMRTPR